MGIQRGVCTGGRKHDRDGFRPAVLLQPDGIPIHPRHNEVQDNHIGPLRRSLPQAIRAVYRLEDLAGGIFKDAAGDRPDQTVVVDDEHAVSHGRNVRGNLTGVISPYHELFPDLRRILRMADRNGYFSRLRVTWYQSQSCFAVGGKVLLAST